MLLQKNVWKGLVRPVALLLLVAALLAVPARTVRAEAPAPDQQTAQFEIKFMEGMIDHHMMAVMMAQMCLEHAEHPELLSTCQGIIATQSAEMMMMQTWLQDWYGITYEPQMPPGHHESMHHRVMQMSAEEFEIWFMRTMIRHHEGAIREASMCLERAYHPELLSLCQNIIATQSAEIAQMQAWLCEWYDICRPE